MMPRRTAFDALAVIWALALIGALFACGPGDEETPSGSGANAAARPAPGGATASSPEGGLRFTDVSASSGITLQNVCGDPLEKLAIPENLGAGAAALDYDGDGLLDIFVANGDVFDATQRKGPARCALYRNLGGLEFADVTEDAGLVFEAWCHGAQAVDFDGDGHTDLYVTIYRGGPNRFFRNRGDGTFEDVSARWGGQDPGPSTTSAFFDADGDGDLDLYVGNYVIYDPESPPNEGNPCEWKGLLVSCGPRGTPPAADTFWENRGGTLVEAGEKFGFAAVAPAFALGSVSGDFDNDGDVDLYVANDSVGNFLFVNDGKGRFAERALHYGVDMSADGAPQAGMGVDFGDVDNDGRFEYFVTNFSHDHNTLYKNQATPGGGTTFSDDSYAMKLGRASFGQLSWGTRIVDLDSDGLQDIVVVCGHVYPQVEQADLGTSYAQFNQVFRNLGPGAQGRISFAEVHDRVGDGFATRKVSRGLVCGDFDNDGDTDLFVVNLDDVPTLLRNDSAGGAWIGFALCGTGLMRDPIGTRLTVEDSEGRGALPRAQRGRQLPLLRRSPPPRGSGRRHRPGEAGHGALARRRHRHLQGPRPRPLLAARAGQLRGETATTQVTLASRAFSERLRLHGAVISVVRVSAGSPHQRPECGAACPGNTARPALVRGDAASAQIADGGARRPAEVFMTRVVHLTWPAVLS